MARLQILHTTYLLLFALLLVSFCMSCKKAKTPLNLPPYSVGHIPFSGELDDPIFKLCNDNFIIENGGRKSAYRGGVKNIKKYFDGIIQNMEYKKGENGYLTIRFLMNCKGDRDRYRILAINERYKPKEFSEHITNPILEAVKKMPDWQLGEHKGKIYDSYNMLTFKINDGLIIDIIP